MSPSRSSPISGGGAAGARRGNGRPYVSLLGSRRQNSSPTAGATVRLRGQGRIDAFFCRRPDRREANINLVSIGSYAHPRHAPARSARPISTMWCRRSSCSASSTRAPWWRRSISSARREQRGQCLSARRPARPITNRCLFAFDGRRRRFALPAHPAHRCRVIENTGFAFDRARRRRPPRRICACGRRGAAAGGLSPVRGQGVQGINRLTASWATSSVSSSAPRDDPGVNNDAAA
jgi:hypothetical protein